jgi:hypothetical protein
VVARQPDERERRQVTARRVAVELALPLLVAPVGSETLMSSCFAGMNCTEPAWKGLRSSGMNAGSVEGRE